MNDSHCEQIELLDVPALMRDIKMASEEIVALKKILRQRWLEPMGARQLELLALKRQVTGLCVVRAWSRGRCHLPKQPHDNSVAAGVWDRSWYGQAAWNAQAYAERVVASVAPAYQLAQPRPPRDAPTATTASDRANLQVLSS